MVFPSTEPQYQSESTTSDPKSSPNPSIVPFHQPELSDDLDCWYKARIILGGDMDLTQVFFMVS